jgi:hypothetical protein
MDGASSDNVSLLRERWGTSDVALKITGGREKIPGVGTVGAGLARPAQLKGLASACHFHLPGVVARP